MRKASHVPELGTVWNPENRLPEQKSTTITHLATIIYMHVFTNPSYFHVRDFRPLGCAGFFGGNFRRIATFYAGASSSLASPHRRIFSLKVLSAIPSEFAVFWRFPPCSLSVAWIAAFSISSIVLPARKPSSVAAAPAEGLSHDSMCSGIIVVAWESTQARSITFPSSRTFPGQS
jgi:hypothetical protein